MADLSSLQVVVISMFKKKEKNPTVADVKWKIYQIFFHLHSFFFNSKEVMGIFFWEYEICCKNASFFSIEISKNCLEKSVFLSLFFLSLPPVKGLWTFRQFHCLLFDVGVRQLLEHCISLHKIFFSKIFSSPFSFLLQLAFCIFFPTTLLLLHPRNIFFFLLDLICNKLTDYPLHTQTLTHQPRFFIFLFIF